MFRREKTRRLVTLNKRFHVNLSKSGNDGCVVPGGPLSRVGTARRGAPFFALTHSMGVMTEPDGLVTYIVGGVVAAFGFGLIAHRLRLPPIVGYLLAGIVIGPHTPGFAADPAIARQIADIGIILIMFGVGLKFSLSALFAFRWRPVVGASAQMLAVTGIGRWLGLNLGLMPVEATIFGFSLSIASTVVLLRALEDGALLTGRTGGIAVCWVLVQDVVTIVALIVMQSLAGASTGEASAAESFTTVAAMAGQVVLFIIFMMVLGRRLLPALLTFLIKAGVRELFSLGVFAIALGVAFLAYKGFGVSFALGAFFAGLVLHEADPSHRATDDMLPLRDAFGVLFFVSVGMLFDPAVFVTQGWTIGAVLAVIVLGNAMVSFTVASALRLPMRQRLIVAAGMAQIGEFSFLLCGFSVGRGLISSETQALILAGALIAIAVNPLVFRICEGLAERLHGAPLAGRRLALPGRH
jgi:K+:H+ antiporter